MKMCSIYHLLINCIIFFHLAPQLTIWSRYSTKDNHLHEFQCSNHDSRFMSQVYRYLSGENTPVNHLTYLNQNDHHSSDQCKFFHHYSSFSTHTSSSQSDCSFDRLDYKLYHTTPGYLKSNFFLSTFVQSLYFPVFSSLFSLLLTNTGVKVNSPCMTSQIVGVQAASDTIHSSRSAHRTLRMFQTHACEGDNLRLNCPKNSAISIYSAHFGGLRSSTQEPSKLCPSHMDRFNLLNEQLMRLNEDERLNSTSRCSSVQAFRIVDSKCRDNRTCTIQASIVEFLAQPNLTLITEQEARKFKQTTEIMIDLCSSDVTYAEAMYKCKPTSILSKGICENEVLHLNCPRRQVIHIYKAFYGPINELYTAQCKSSDNQIEMKPIKSNSITDEEDECQVTNETEMLIEHCQGYRKCNLIASDEIFYKNQTDALYQTNCRKRKRLKVHYTCTNPKILTDDYQNRQQTDSHEFTSSTVSLPSSEDNFLNGEDGSGSSSSEQMQSGEQTSTSTQSVPNHFEIASVREMKDKNVDGSIESDLNEDANCTTIMAKKSAIGFVSEWIQAVYYVSGNLERLLLYFLVSILFALLCIVIVMSCKLQKDKNRVKKCIKQQQIPSAIFEYIPDDDDEENLMLPANTPQHYKQLQRQQLSALLNQQTETNNNTLQQPSRNATRTMLLMNTGATGENGRNLGTMQPASTFYGSQQALRGSPTSQINPNYIHPFLNEQELINRTEEDEDEEGSPKFSELNPDRHNLMVFNATPIRSSFKAQNIAQLTTSPKTSERPILIKDHASTIHIIRTSKPVQRSLVVQTNNRTALSSSTLSALLSGRMTNNRAHQYQFSNSFFNDRLNDERRPMLSSSPNLHPMHVLTTTSTTSATTSVTPTSANSANTTLTSANATTSLSNPSSSPQEMETFSQRTTPLSKNRLLNFDTPNEQLNACLTKSKSSPAYTPNSPLSPSSPQSPQSPKSPQSPNSPHSPQNRHSSDSSSLPSKTHSKSPLSASSPQSMTNEIDVNNSLNEIKVENNAKRPAWLSEASPIKQNALIRRSFDDSYKKTSQTISSVGENLFD